MLKFNNRNSRTKCSKLTICSKLEMKIPTWRQMMLSYCLYSWLWIFSIGDFEKVVVCYDIIFASLCSNFSSKRSCLSIYNLILNSTVYWFTFKSSKLASLQWMFWNALYIFLRFNSFYSYWILHDFDAIWNHSRRVENHI